MTYKTERWKLYHHIILTPKYRKPFMADPAISRGIERWIKRGAALKNVRIDAIAVMPDHVHILISLPTGCSLAEAAHMMKWLSSIQIRKAHPELKQHRAFWGARYWARTVAGDGDRVSAYIQNNIP